MTYRLFQDGGHSWLEVPREEVAASGAAISRYSYYDPSTDMAYLEMDCDLGAFLDASGQDVRCVGETVYQDDWWGRGRLARYVDRGGYI